MKENDLPVGSLDAAQTHPEGTNTATSLEIEPELKATSNGWSFASLAKFLAAGSPLTAAILGL